jgi:hypothetical protein
MGTNCLCLFGPNLWGPINTGTQSSFILDKTGCIKQGPIAQGQTLTGMHETGMRRHSTQRRIE